MTKSLAVDIGNTETAIGVYEGVRGSRKHRETIRLPTDVRATGDLIFSLLTPHIESGSISRVAISSVVPALTAAWREYGAKISQANTIVLESIRIPGIEIKIPRPDEAGIDRIVNSWMGFRRYGGPLVVADLGTATTFDVIDEKGAYLGGVISPGVNLFAESLAVRTAKLPRIALEKPERVVGRSTQEALRSGTILGHAAMVEGMIKRIFAETGATRAVATGGLAHSVRPMLNSLFAAFDPTLTIDGITAIADEIG